MKFFILSIFGKDRRGIVAKVSKVLYELGLNLEDSSMTRLNGEFTIMMVVSSESNITPDEISNSLKEVIHELELFFVCKELDVVETPPCHALYRVVVFGSDKPGIVYTVTSKLADLGLNISDLRTEKRGELYVMIIEAEGEEFMEDALREGLEDVRASLGVEVSFEREGEERL